jgi:hypothetical protein
MRDAAMAKAVAARHVGRRSGIPVAGSGHSPVGSTAGRGGVPGALAEFPAGGRRHVHGDGDV